MNIPSKGAIVFSLFGILLFAFSYYSFNYKVVDNGMLIAFDILALYAIVFSYYLWQGRKAMKFDKEYNDKHLDLHNQINVRLEKLAKEIEQIKWQLP